MSTRGAYGLSKNGTDKILYNHFDSYPTGLGKDILQFIVDNDNEELNKLFDEIKVVKSDNIPTEADVNKVITTVGAESLKKELIGKDYLINGESRKIKSEKDLIDFLKADYYNLLYVVPTEDLFSNLVNIFEDYISFIGNSLFCEYAYILNLDTNVLDFYIGGNEEPTGNRFSKYAKDNDSGYVECKLVLSIPFNIIRKNQVAVLDILEFIDKKLED